MTSHAVITTAPVIVYSLCRVHRLLAVIAASPLPERSDRQASCQLAPFRASSARAEHSFTQLVALAATLCCRGQSCFIHVVSITGLTCPLVC